MTWVPCPNEDCENGRVYVEKHRDYGTCPTCKGEGEIEQIGDDDASLA